MSLCLHTSNNVHYVPFFSELQNTFFHKIKECEMILSCCLFYGDIHITVTITTDVVAWGALEQSKAES